MPLLTAYCFPPSHTLTEQPRPALPRSCAAQPSSSLPPPPCRHWAASAGNEAVVSLLLGARPAPRINLADNQGMTPLILAARRGHVAVVAALCKARASLSMGDDAGRTVL